MKRGVATQAGRSFHFASSLYAAGWGNAEVASRDGLADGATASARVGQANLHGMFGLNADPGRDKSYASLDYAWSLGADGRLQIHEGGVLAGGFGPYAAGDELVVAYEGGTVRYLHNGVVKRSVATHAGRRFHFDASLYSPDFRLEQVRFAPGEPVGIRIDGGQTPVLLAGGGVAIQGDAAVKTGAAGWGNAEVSSRDGLSGRAVASAVAGQANLHGMFGLNADPAPRVRQLNA